MDLELEAMGLKRPLTDLVFSLLLHGHWVKNVRRKSSVTRWLASLGEDDFKQASITIFGDNANQVELCKMSAGMWATLCTRSFLDRANWALMRQSSYANDMLIWRDRPKEEQAAELKKVDAIKEIIAQWHWAKQ